jgi:hypothetical protein
MVASLVVSSAFGSVLLGMVKVHANPYLLFVAGFIILNLLMLIPVLGFITRIVAVGLGFGAMLVVFLAKMEGMRGSWGSAV